MSGAVLAVVALAVVLAAVVLAAVLLAAVCSAAVCWPMPIFFSTASSPSFTCCGCFWAYSSASSFSLSNSLIAISSPVGPQSCPQPLRTARLPGVAGPNPLCARSFGAARPG